MDTQTSSTVVHYCCTHIESAAIRCRQGMFIEQMNVVLGW